MKYGLLGGTFDPVHFGHLRCAQEILEALDLDKVCFVPSAQPPLKHRTTVAPFGDRLNMVRLAISDNPAFEVSDLENLRKGPSYTIDTINGFLQKGMTDLYFILGQDAFDDIRKWKDWNKFLMLCHFVIMARPGYDAGALQPALPKDYAEQFQYRPDEDAYAGPDGKTIRFRRVTFLDISSTDIRERIKQGKSVRYLLPDAVRDYIARKGLYTGH